MGIWSASTIRHILHNAVYIGDMVQNKENKISYKSKKVVQVPPEKWVIVKNTHEAIISYDIFVRCNTLMSKKIRILNTQLFTIRHRKMILIQYDRK